MLLLQRGKKLVEPHPCIIQGHFHVI